MLANGALLGITHSRTVTETLNRCVICNASAIGRCVQGHGIALRNDSQIRRKDKKNIRGSVIINKSG